MSQINNYQNVLLVLQRAAQRNDSPAADLTETKLHKITSSVKWPPHPGAGGGQGEPVFGPLCNINHTNDNSFAFLGTSFSFPSFLPSHNLLTKAFPLFHKALEA
jgi:hypothetical protein